VLADPLSVLATVAILGSIAAVYLRGARARRGRGLRRPSGGGIGATMSGLALAAVALSAPADSLADQLFWAHMVQHLVLIAVAAPLVVLGEPLLTIGEVAPGAWRRAGGRLSGRLWRSTTKARRTAAVTWAVAGIVLICWHAPVAFDAAVRVSWLHALEHLMLFTSAVAFWWPILLPAPRGRIGPAVAIAGVIAMSTLMSVLGAALVFSPSVWYPANRTAEIAHGIDPLADQQLAGSIMWVPAGLIYLGVAAWLFITWAEDAAERRTRVTTQESPRPPRAGERGRRAVG